MEAHLPSASALRVLNHPNACLVCPAQVLYVCCRDVLRKLVKRTNRRTKTSDSKKIAPEEVAPLRCLLTIALRDPKDFRRFPSLKAIVMSLTLQGRSERRVYSEGGDCLYHLENIRSVRPGLDYTTQSSYPSARPHAPR